MRWDTHNHVVPESLVDIARSGFPVSVDGDTVTADGVRFTLTREFTDPAVKLRRPAEAGLDAAAGAVGVEAGTSVLDRPLGTDAPYDRASPDPVGALLSVVEKTPPGRSWKTTRYVFSV
ncbi:hypothetical protein OG943_17900 [Amycolatopsis sp. NBC_00345]|uniref:hypothetical protein n=1 Tax=Amycolatopsis sp. NBC_00345 TaxID=2975955 RepID=UPI002E263B44